MANLTDQIKTEVVDPPNKDGDADINLNEFIGEGKKYASTEDAVKALLKKAVHADTHIETILSEKRTLEDQYREAITKVKTQEELFNAITSQTEKRVGVDNPPMESLSPDKVQNLIKDALTKKAQEDEALMKVQKAKDILAQEYGNLEEATKRIQSYVNGDPSKKAVVDQLALVDPQKLISILGKPDPITQPNTVNKSGFNDNKIAQSTLTWSEAKRIKKESLSTFKSLDFQRKLNDAIATNPNFFTT